MSNDLRPHAPGATIFFTARLEQRGDDLLRREIERLRQAVRITRAERPFAIDAWVVLPGHIQTIWTLPEGDRDYSTRWRLIKARFSQGLRPGPQGASPRLRREGGIWQRRFSEHHLRDPADFDRHLHLCLAAPVRLGLARRAEDWPWSSIHHLPEYRAAASGASYDAPDVGRQTERVMPPSTRRFCPVI